MKRILVTGGAGFIGGNFIQHVLGDADVRILNLDLLTYAGNPDTLTAVEDDPSYRFVQGNIGDRRLVEQLLTDFGPMIIVNFAAESHVDRSIDGPEKFIETNVLGTFNLLECTRRYWSELDADAQRAFRFLHVSTDEVYGSLGEDGAFTEVTPYAPNSPYSASKASSDHLVRAWHHTYGLPTLTTNCSNNYGPYQFPEKLIPLMTLNAIDGKALPIYGDGGNIRDWLYVEDHCRAIWRVLEAGNPGEVYNIGGNSERTNIEIVDAICVIIDELLPDAPWFPHRQLMTFVPDRPGHDHRYAIDATKIKRQLGWEPRETFETGIRKSVEWYVKNRAWCDRVLDGGYQGERLGLRA